MCAGVGWGVVSAPVPPPWFLRPRYVPILFVYLPNHTLRLALRNFEHRFPGELLRKTMNYIKTVLKRGAVVVLNCYSGADQDYIMERTRDV